MQNRMNEVIAQRVQTPQMVLNPETGMNQRVVLRSRGELKPDSPQPMEITQRGILCDIGIVVPYVAGVPHLLIGNHDRQGEKGAEKPGRLPPSRRRNSGDRFAA